MYGIHQEACIAFDRLEKNWNLVDIIHYNPTLSFGAIKRSQLNLRFVRTILAFNTLILTMLTIFLIPSKNTTQYQLIGEEKVTAALI